MPGRVIAGRYRLDELLGRGGMSEVWAADDGELGRRVAIKLLAPDADTGRFEREARAFASLAHPNVTQVYDYGEEDGRPYMVLEYLGGGTLEDRLRGNRPLPDGEAFSIATGIATGLAHAHARGVVHRDLKPANVLFDDEGRPKLADFGIARLAAGDGTLTDAGTVLGTAAYISPEQATGEPASAASDVYSFGVILYRMLTGRLPFESNDPLQLVLHHRDATPPPIASLRGDAPPVLAALATAALAKDPRERPRDGAALLDALGAPAAAGPATLADAATQVLPVAAMRAAAPAPADAAPLYPTPPGRSRVAVVVAGLAVLALAGGALAYEISRPSSSSVDTGTLPSITIPTHASTTATTATAPTTTQGATTATTGQTTATTATPTTQPQTVPATTAAPTTVPTTTSLPAATTDLTTTDVTTTASPPATTAP
jgi:serine/threonine-protein kinase